MANTKVALLRYCRLEIGWRRLAVTPVRKGRGWDVQIKVPKHKKVLELGDYQLWWYEGTHSRFEGAGKDLREAITSRDNQVCNARAAGKNARAKKDHEADTT